MNICTVYQLNNVFHYKFKIKSLGHPRVRKGSTESDIRTKKHG